MGLSQYQNIRVVRFRSLTWWTLIFLWNLLYVLGYVISGLHTKIQRKPVRANSRRLLRSWHGYVHLKCSEHELADSK